MCGFALKSIILQRFPGLYGLFEKIPLTARDKVSINFFVKNYTFPMASLENRPVANVTLGEEEKIDGIAEGYPGTGKVQQSAGMWNGKVVSKKRNIFWLILSRKRDNTPFQMRCKLFSSLISMHRRKTDPPLCFNRSLKTQPTYA